MLVHRYLGSIAPNSSAGKAALLDGDFLLKINGKSVSSASIDMVTNSLHAAGDTVKITVESSAIVHIINGASLLKVPA